MSKSSNSLAQPPPPRRMQADPRMLGASPVPETGSASSDPPPLQAAKPLSNKFAALAVRSRAVGAPSTTAISRLPPRDALATTLNPAAQVNPVFIPSAPG